MSERIIRELRLAADLTQRRDDMRLLLGAEYAQRIKFYRETLRRVADQRGDSLLDTGLSMSKKMSAAGHDPSMLIAAMVDEIEAGE